MIAKRALPWCVVHVGARAEIVFAPEPPKDAAEMRPALAQRELNHALHLYLINRGVLIAPFHMMMLVCPSTTTQQIDRLVAAVDSFAEEYTRKRCMTIADPKEVKSFLDKHPEIQFFEIVFTNMAGVPRGKRLRRHEIEAVYEHGRFLPGSILVNDITGQDVEATGLVWEDGDADRVARPIAGRLTPAPWLGADVAQVPVTMYELDGTPHDLDPRHVLQRVIDRFAADGLDAGGGVRAGILSRRRAARRRTARFKLPRSPLTGDRATQHQVYGLREVEEASPFLRDLWAAADAMGVPLEGAISEYAPGQLELTLKHHADALRAADDAVLYKRAAKGVALAARLRSDVHGQAVRRAARARACICTSASTTRRARTSLRRTSPRASRCWRTRSAA